MNEITIIFEDKRVWQCTTNVTLESAANGEGFLRVEKDGKTVYINKRSILAIKEGSTYVV